MSVVVKFDDMLTVAYSTVDDGNMDERFSDRSSVMQHRRQFLRQFGLNPKLVIEAKQIHSDRVLPLDEENIKMWTGTNIPGVDGFITNRSEVGLILKLADCVPVVILDKDNGAYGFFHNGWQGTVKGIHTKGLKMMMAKYGTNENSVKVWIGPMAKKCCYISDDLPKQIEEMVWNPYIKEIGGKWQVDLLGYLVDSLTSLGVKKKNIVIDDNCTVESSELFSHQRAIAKNEVEGRFVVLVKLK